MIAIHPHSFKVGNATIDLTQHDGLWWVALKPICIALDLDWIYYYKVLCEDVVFNEQRKLLPMVAVDNKKRRMVCLPERYVYGWLFSLRPRRPEYQLIRKDLYDGLFTLFRQLDEEELKSSLRYYLKLDGMKV